MNKPPGLQHGVWEQVRLQGKKYLLEVNPHFTDSSTRDKHNVIDARFIDCATGLFIDITTVHPVPLPSSSATILTSTTHPFFSLDNHPSPREMYTKDTHLYTTSSLFPLRDTAFEGSRVSVPYAYEQLLEEEYGPRALVETWFDGWGFDRARREWVVAPMPEAGRRREGDGKGKEKGKGKGKGKGSTGGNGRGRLLSDEERSRMDNMGRERYVPTPGRAGDVHVVPGSA